MQENDGDGDGEVGAALLEARKKLNQMQSGYSTSLASSLHTPGKILSILIKLIT